ncbi:MAG TPA: hypothetical protein VJ112_04155, partial [Rhabdochlamydiaceae bacterium]|nr:hypothetical protein [Rhabdochlamydiaceae bacterium]
MLGGHATADLLLHCRRLTPQHRCSQGCPGQAENHQAYVMPGIYVKGGEDCARGYSKGEEPTQPQPTYLSQSNTEEDWADDRQ